MLFTGVEWGGKLAVRSLGAISVLPDVKAAHNI